MAEPIEWTPVDREPLRDAWVAWQDLIATTHHGRNHRINAEVTFVPLDRPLSSMRMALVTTAGAHLDAQDPFHVATTAGDSSFRELPDDLDPSTIRFTHTHYDTAPAGEDHNVVLPLGPLHRSVADGRIGSASPVHIGMMGFNPDPSVIADETGPAVAGVLADHEVDVALLVPG